MPSPRALTAISEMNTRANRQARDDWELFTAHRQRLTEAIASLRPGTGGVLCLLGAGNCNDVDLEALAGAYAEIHLVDIDPAGLDRAPQRQPPEGRPRPGAHGGGGPAGGVGRAPRGGG